MMRMMVRLQNWLRNESGQALSEYGVVLALVLLAVVGTVGIFGDELKAVFERIIAGIK